MSYHLIHQRDDRCDVDGFPFESVGEALDAARRLLGVEVEGIVSMVHLERFLPVGCVLVHPIDEADSDFCREGRMTLIAADHSALEVAIRLTRRHTSRGRGRVISL